MKSSTASAYNSALKDYSKFHNMSIKDLIKEADYEEEKRIREKKRTIRKRLEEYRNYKIEYGSSRRTIKKYFAMVKTFYRHHEIIIPYIPEVQLKRDYHEKYEDIPKINHIKKAVESTDDLMEKAIILFMSSSGTARNETLSLTVEDFFKACEKYINIDIYDKNIKYILDELSSKNNIIPLFELVRIKTDYHYYTCCSDESSEMIINYLKNKKMLKLESKLFDMNRNRFNKFFMRINMDNNWGQVGYYGFFRSHALRKFHATVIEDKSLADALQGRRRDSVTESYYKLNPERIRERYLEVFHKLRIFQKPIELNNGYNQLKKDNESLNERLKKLEELVKGLVK
ncbi:MAG: integrase [Methanobrevibacter sp.]|nr:integrase [Methanobrevibacter sp.]